MSASICSCGQFLHPIHTPRPSPRGAPREEEAERCPVTNHARRPTRAVDLARRGVAASVVAKARWEVVLPSSWFRAQLAGQVQVRVECCNQLDVTSRYCNTSDFSVEDNEWQQCSRFTWSRLGVVRDPPASLTVSFAGVSVNRVRPISTSLCCHDRGLNAIKAESCCELALQ